MTSPSSIVLEIPELLHIIGLNAERADLPSLALANKILNVGITILLYRDITLDRYRPTSRCMITLSTPPNRLAFGRDLASLVQVMDIRDPVIGRHLARSSRGSIAEMLAHAFPRMLNLRRLSSTMKLPRYTLILRILATTPFESLESFKFSPYYPVGEDGPAEKLQPFLPVLDTFQVDLRNIKVRFVVPVHEAILCSRAHCLRSLALLSVPNGLLSLLPAFPTLETLEVQASQLNFPCFRHANSVKSLILHDTFDRLDTPVEDLFPSLEEISCSALLIPVFLPPTSGRRRPIRTVRLRNATYEKFGDMSSFLPMSWSTDSPTMISQAIAHLQFSASAVTTLSFCMHDLHLAIEVLTELIPHLESIESLLLVLDGESVSCDILGPQLIAHLPNLHSFLMSDAPLKDWHMYKGFAHARKLDFQRSILAELVKIRPTLKRVAFTNEVEWEERGGVWCHSPVENLMKYYEDDDAVALDEVGIN